MLAAINAKYIHSNPGVYSLKMYAEHYAGAREGAGGRGGRSPEGQSLPPVRVEIAEYTINNQMEQILEDVYRRQPDMLGISCYIWNITYALDLVHDLHKVLPETDIWLGGPEVSFDAPKLLEREPELLGVMKGEGEETFAGLLQCYGRLGRSVRSAGREAGQPDGGGDAGTEARLESSGAIRAAAGARTEAEMESENGGGAEVCRNLERFWQELAGVAGLTYRAERGEIRDQAVRPVMDMSRIPFMYPDLDGFEHRIVYYESSRGCPFSCSYCLSSIDKSVRFRDLELVKRELDFFLERKVHQVKFVDRTFNCKKSHAMAIWQYILENDNGVTNFHFEVAADIMDQEELELISRMRPGLIQLEIGVQSTNPDTIREIRRKMDLERVRQVVAQVNAGHNVHQHLDLIAGLPYEDYDSFRRSFNDVYAMEPEQLQLGFLKVLKGSYMYEMAPRYDLVYRKLPPYEVLSTRWLPYADVLRLKGVENMVEVYYNSGQFVNTLKLLTAEFPDAFAVYESLAQYYDENGLNGMSHSRLARYEILHDFIGSMPERQRTLAAYEDALMCDLYLRENSKSRPAFAPDQAVYKNRIRELAPELRSLGTQIHVEVLRCGQIWKFDYRTKDPLTKNAQMIRLA